MALSREPQPIDFRFFQVIIIHLNYTNLDLKATAKQHFSPGFTEDGLQFMQQMGAIWTVFFFCF